MSKDEPSFAVLARWVYDRGMTPDTELGAEAMHSFKNGAKWAVERLQRQALCSCGMAPLTVCENCAIAEYQRLEREAWDGPKS